ncbi:MAG: DUF5074 domain-containing protein [Firmicutes bacterium]|nr:DUF5074 domain-containing protein [Bacillota bacterium]MCM1401585.1 DUF5074 domain-containing protein [Bacteroides sp.]
MNRIFFKLIFIAFFWFVPAAASAAVTDFVMYPSPDKPIHSISTLRIEFPEAKFLGMYGSQLIGVTLTKADDPSVVYEPVNPHYPISNNQTFSLRRKGDPDGKAVTVTEPGNYVLHFPERCFELCGSWYVNLDWSKEINVTYTISGNGSEGYDNFFDRDKIAVRPMPGRILEFSDITLEFPLPAGDAVIEAPGIDLITMKRVGDNPREYKLVNCEFDYDRSILLRFCPKDAKYSQDVPVFEPGEYVVDVPAGVVRLGASDVVNPAMQLVYNVTGPNDASFHAYTLTPAEGTLSEIEEIVLDFPELDKELNFPDGVVDVTNYLNDVITLTKLEKDPDTQRVYIPFSVRRVGNRSLAMRFRPKSLSQEPSKHTVVATRGDYLLNIPPNTFKGKGNDFSFNRRIMAYYTVDRAVVADPMSVYQLDPANNTALGELKGASITFPEVTEGLVWPFDRDKIKLVNVETPDVSYKAVGVMMMGNTVSWSIGMPDEKYSNSITLTAPGTYRLTIEPGTFVAYADRSHTNAEITSVFTISPNLNFTCQITPEHDSYLTELESITVQCTQGATNLRVNAGQANPPLLTSGGGVTVNLTPQVVSDTEIRFAVEGTLTPGLWTARFPAGYFTQTNADGVDVTNISDISARYNIVELPAVGNVVRPASGSEVTGIASISIVPVMDNFRSLAIDNSVGSPVLQNGTHTVTLTATASDYAVALFPTSANLEPGTWTLTVPAGFINVTDGHGITVAMDAISATYAIVNYSPSPLSSGIFILNEGAYGTDYGSVSFIDRNTGAINYNLFQKANKGTHLGVTSQFGELYGNHFLTLSKQTDYNGTSGALLTCASAADMSMQWQTTVSNADGRSICGIDSEKVYVGTDSGILIYNLTDGTCRGTVKGTESANGHYADQIGEMILLNRHLFAAHQGKGIDVVDSDTDLLLTTISLPSIASLTVTATGRLVAATTDSSQPFMEINPESFTITPFSNVTDTPVAFSWNSWRKAPLATSISGDVLYFATEELSPYVARYDAGSLDYSPRFIKLPSVGRYQMVQYGSSLSVDPETGYIVIQAVGMGSSPAYNLNRIYFADASTGVINQDLTVEPESHYWFPAMALYPVADAPMISHIPVIELGGGVESEEIDLAANTSLSVGNSSLITYTARCGNPSVCNVARIAPGRFLVSALSDGISEITFTATYRGMAAECVVPVVVKNSAAIVLPATDAVPMDVYGLDGVLIQRNASPEFIDRLPRGFYIIGGKKVLK